MRFAWYALGVLLAAAEVGLHLADYSIPLAGRYAIMTAADDPGVCGLTYERKRIVERLTAYQQVTPEIVLLEIAGGVYGIA
jgi:hypothetical protein